MEYIDLTHTLSETVPTWDGGCGFEIFTALDYKECTEPNLFRVQKIKSNAGIGTHIDAPAHCIPEAATIDSLKLNDLITECVVITVDCNGIDEYVIMPTVVEEFEKQHGAIHENSFVIFNTGWEQRWGTPEKYQNNYMFPSVHITTAELLLSRNIVGIGTDTLSVDTGKEGFPVHRAVLGKGKYLVENIANAKLLPPMGAKIFVLPIKMQDATEAPIRLIAVI